MRENFRYFNSVKTIDDMATGKRTGLCGIPKEGTVIWIDSMVISSDVVNSTKTQQFIDYMLRPEVIADVSNTIFIPMRIKRLNRFKP